MKIKIDKKAKFGNKEFPYKEILSICFGTFGDFEKPYYHKVICAEYKDEDGIHHYKIIGEYFHVLKVKKYLLFGKVLSVTLFGFKSEFRKEDVENLIELGNN